MSDLATLFTAFAIAWAITCGYVWHLGRRTNDLRRQLETLESRLRRDDSAPR